ncbi:MAG: hypothetical protein H0Z37_06600 [Firmicutes bacterium]|nr:hypothetical protein [Bacillota bacterium]
MNSSMRAKLAIGFVLAFVIGALAVTAYGNSGASTGAAQVRAAGEDAPAEWGTASEVPSDEEGAGNKAEEPNGTAEAGAEPDELAAGVTDVQDQIQNPNAADVERARLLARWDELMQERRQLLAELRALNREMLEIANQLWPKEWESTRDRILDRLDEYEERIGELGDEIAPWVPPALLEHIAELTGRTPEEIHRLIEEGNWRELFTAQP